jgi:hypothetical protein
LIKRWENFVIPAKDALDTVAADLFTLIHILLSLFHSFIPFFPFPAECQNETGMTVTFIHVVQHPQYWFSP